MTYSPYDENQSTRYDAHASQRQAGFARDARHAPSGYVYDARYASGSGHAATARKPIGAGKAFLCGMLGALTAGAVAFGGFTAWNSFNESAVPAYAETGSSASMTTVKAVGEDHMLGEAVAAKALPSVVAVYNYQRVPTGYGSMYGTASSSDSLQAAGMGSGVVISEDGYILTNYHVVEGASELTIKVGDEEREATYIGGDDSSDVAVIKVDNVEGLVPAEIGDSDKLAVGQWVMTVGAPLGLEQSVATGVVSAMNRSTIMDDSTQDGLSYYSGATPEYTYYPNMIQTDAMINPGNSGGALVDAEGKLIGINTMISSSSGNYAGVGFAIPVNYAMGIAEDVIAGKEPTHALLGVSVSTVNATNAQRYGLSTTSGAYVSKVNENASEAGLQAGDIITAINGKAVSSATDVTLDVREHKPGETVTVTVNRDGEELEFAVELGTDQNIAS